jgi:EAL domain-containing protein (putative c-di-GMP-specific phosphodiesterase class I)/GGDEF domain-containing protein
MLGGAIRRSEPSGPVDPHRALTAIGQTAFSWDIATDAIAWSPNAAAALGIPHIDLFGTGRALADAIEPEGGSTRSDLIGASTGTDQGCGRPYGLRYGLRTKADRLVVVEETGRWFADTQGRPCAAQGLLRVSKAAAGDHFTFGLRARAALLARIMDDVVEAQRSRHAMTLVVGTIDPDDDTDSPLSEVERRIRPLLRRRDSFMVYAPNRFALALASCPGTEAEAAVKRLFALVAASAESDCLVDRLRVGAASAPDHAIDAPELLRHAEEALAEAQRSETRRFAIFRAGARDRGAPRCGTAPDVLIDALNERRLVLAYGCVADAQTRSPAFVQGVLRLRTPEGRIIAPGDISLVAERAGLSTLIDARALELAAERLATHPAERIVVDITSATLNDSEWLTLLAAHLGARPGIESRLIVGIPETALRDMPATRGRLDAMKALGVGISLCGFGRGFATSKHLRSLPLDMVRLEGSFVQNALRSPDDRLFLRRLIDLAQHFGIASRAEWVDDPETARLLADWGVDYLQGNLFGEAVPTDSDANPRMRATA